MAPELQQQGVFILVIFAAVMAERGWQWLKRRTARAWPTAQARVQKAEWHQPRTGTNRYFLADLSYSYIVEGQFYAGYHRRSFASADAAALWVEQMRNANVQVRRHAADPTRSMLLEEDVAPLAAIPPEAVASR